MMRQLALKVLFILLAGYAFAEGTKELRPASTDQGSLLLMPSYSMFGIYGTSAKQQLKIRINSVSETVYFGFNNKNGIDPFGVNNDNGVFVPNIPFRIVSPSGTIVYTSVIPALGDPGNIATWNEAVAGPLQLGNPLGYNALSLIPSETGDYILEFNPGAIGITRLNLHLFDVTVAGNDNAPILGRLHSQGWQVSTGSYTNSFRGKVYPYDGSSAVYEVDFNGMQPWVFVINFNSTGTGNTGVFTLDRQSKIGNFAFGEYEVFLNPPDELLYPTQPKFLTLTGNVIKNDCINSDFCLDFTTNSAGELGGFIDFNSNGIYDSDAGEIYFEDTFTSAGTKCVSWNGKDLFGNPVTGNFQVIASIGFGITHLPLYDVEHNQSGYKVNIVRPIGSTPPIIFWDDSQLTDGSVLDSKVNLTGCYSALSGCHKWLNRGSILNPLALNRQETINTWWYSTLATTTFLISVPPIQNVQLSFHPANLVKRDTTVCRGDSLSFYVYNDGQHFNLTNYTYEWWFNSVPITSDIRTQKEKIMGPSEVIVRATDRSGGGCVSYDTLHVLVVDPVTLEAVTIQPTCSTFTGSIDVQLLTGPPDKAFFWQEFPGLNSGILNNLPAGTYHLLAQDPAYPHCAADTSFTITATDAIAIDTVIITTSYCSQSLASAEVFMVDILRNYEYSWDASAFTGNSVHNALSPGTHSVIVRDIATGCTDQRTFVIQNTRLLFSASSSDELCQNGQGQITLALPSEVNDFIITWNGISGNQISKSNLSAGSFVIHVVSPSYPECVFDTTITIQNINRNLIIQNLSVTNIDCQNSSGAAAITMLAGSYQYSWDGGNFGTGNQVSNLEAGTHTIRIRENGTDCIKDTSFVIQSTAFQANVSSENEICSADNGSITIVSTNPAATEVIWADGTPSTYYRNNLNEGTYAFTVRDKNKPSCKIDRVVVITNTTYSLNADFSYKMINPDSLGKKVIGFTNLSKNYQWSSWDFGDLTTSSKNHPVHAFSVDMEYTVRLHVVDSNGCWGEVAKKISPFKLVYTSPCGDIALPNVFSPNKDGVNDDIGILVSGDAPKVELLIFNRWGEVIFRTFSISYRWDGNYRNEEVPVGVYPYILKWECPDENGKIIRFQKVGDITLVR